MSDAHPAGEIHLFFLADFSRSRKRRSAKMENALNEGHPSLAGGLDHSTISQLEGDWMPNDLGIWRAGCVLHTSLHVGSTRVLNGDGNGKWLWLNPSFSLLSSSLVTGDRTERASVQRREEPLVCSL